MLCVSRDWLHATGIKHFELVSLDWCTKKARGDRLNCRLSTLLNLCNAPLPCANAPKSSLGIFVV